MKKHLTKGFITALLVAVLMAVFAVNASAAETTVTTETELRSAVTNAANGDVITVKGTIEVTSGLTLPAGTNEDSRKKVTIKGDPTDGADEIKAADSFVNGGVSNNAGVSTAMFKVNNWSTLVLTDLKLNANIWVKDQDGNYGIREGVSLPKLRCITLNGYRAYCELRGDTTLTGGYSGNGGGIFSYGRAFMYDNSKITGNYTTGSGGGVYMENNAGTYHYLWMYDNSAIEYNAISSSATGGGGVYCTGTDGRIYIYENSRVSNNNSAGGGGGIYLSQGYLTVEGNAKIENNKARHGGGIYNKAGTATISGNASISNNISGAGASSGDGGAIYNAATLYIKGGYISGNTFDKLNFGGTAVFNHGTNATIEMSGGVIGKHASYPNSAPNTGRTAAVVNLAKFKMTGGYISGNVNTTSDGSGGGMNNRIYNSYTGSFTMEGGEISNNNADNGAGVLSAGTLKITGGNFVNNYSKYYGCAIRVNGGEASISGVTIGGINENIEDDPETEVDERWLSNYGSRGSALYVTKGTVDVSNVNISYNTQGTGAIYVYGGTVNLSGTAEKPTTIANNKSNAHGGGVYVADGATLNVTGVVTISGNKTPNSSGAGIYTNGTVNLGGNAEGAVASTITISGNISSSNSGGIRVGRNTTTIYDGVTITGNTAGSYGGGIAVFKDTSGTPTLVIKGGTIENNTATTTGGGIYVGTAATVTMTGGTITGNIGKKAAGGVYVADYADTTFTVSGTATVTDNYLGEEKTVVNNVEFDDFLSNPKRITVAADHTGTIGIYYNALAYNAGKKIVIGALEEGVETFNITNDNAWFAAAQADGQDVVFTTGAAMTVKIGAAGEEAVEYEVIKAADGKYALPKASMLGAEGKLIGITDGTNFYTADEIADGLTLTAEQMDGKTLTLMTLKFEGVAGASVKLGDTNSSGMRFFTRVDEAMLKTLVELGAEYQRGMLVGTDKDADYVLTDVNGTTVRNAVVDADYVKATETWKGSMYFDEAELGTDQVYSVGLNIQSSGLYAQEFLFRGYMKIRLAGEEIVLYTDFNTTDNCRSAAQVADEYAAWLETNGTWNEENQRYEGFTAEQYASLVAMAAANDEAAE